MSFSKRMGLVPIEVPIQLDDMTIELRNSLWNLLLVSDFADQEKNEFDEIFETSILKKIEWLFFKKNLSDLPRSAQNYIDILKDWIISAHWFEVYDFLEFVLKLKAPVNTDTLNQVLEMENSGYRFLNGKFIPISGDNEITSLKISLSHRDKYSSVREHVETAMNLMSDKRNPNYRNSIKESISAVEAVAKVIAGSNDFKLPSILQSMERKGKLHSSLKEGFKNLYGWTNKDGGIRHAMMEKSNLDLADARYMLVTCSAFVNLLIEKHEANR